MSWKGAEGRAPGRQGTGPGTKEARAESLRENRGCLGEGPPGRGSIQVIDQTGSGDGETLGHPPSEDLVRVEVGSRKWREQSHSQGVRTSEAHQRNLTLTLEPVALTTGHPAAPGGEVGWCELICKEKGLDLKGTGPSLTPHS